MPARWPLAAVISGVLTFEKQRDEHNFVKEMFFDFDSEPRSPCHRADSRHATLMPAVRSV
jgi:hypothetical protein